VANNRIRPISMRSHFGILIYLLLDRFFACAVDVLKTIIQPWMVDTYLLVNINRVGVALDIGKPILPGDSSRLMGALLPGDRRCTHGNAIISIVSTACSQTTAKVPRRQQAPD